MLSTRTIRRSMLSFFIALSCLAPMLHAQGGGVAIEFPSPDSIHVTAGEPVEFELVARDAAGDVITNWDSVGTNIMLEIENSGAMSDSSARSWNADPDGYSWVRVYQVPNALPPFTDYSYLITKDQFSDGRLQLSFVDTRDEYWVRLRVLPKVIPLNQLSPPIRVHPAGFTNLLVDVIYANWDERKIVYRDRPFEVGCFPRDRYMNWTNDTVAVILRTRFPETVLDPPTTSYGWDPPSLADSATTVFGPSAFYGSLTVPRIEGSDPGQWFEILCRDDTSIRARTDTIFVHDHAPYPFEQYDPPDGAHVNLDTASPDSVMTFRWHPAWPPDPYTNMYVGRYDPATYSDRVFYRVTFYDPTTQQIGGSSAWTEGKDGRLDSTLTITVAEFTSFLQNAQPGWNGGPTELFWYTVATDTTYETPTSSISADGERGFRIVVNAGTNAAGRIPTAQLPMLEQNAPNPFHGSTHIRFVTVAAGQVSLTVHDLLGRTMARLVDQRLEPGRHDIRFDATYLPAGTYLYRLSCNDRQLWRQMVLLP